MAKGKISVQSKNIFPIIKQFLYSDQEIFLRELVSNAIDATSKIKTLHSKGEFKGELGDLTIQISIDEEAKTLTISDRGLGMSAEEVKKYLNQVAFSSAQEFLDKYQSDQGIIGNFGLGFYSSFMVADKVEVISQSHNEEEKAIVWSCEGEPEYEIKTGKRDSRGTDVILHISDDASEYLEKNRIQSLLEKYCRFLPVQIQFGMKTESTWEGEGEDRKEIKTEVPNLVNNPNPAWRKSPSELSDEDYLNFYKELYPFSKEPLFWIHLNIDYPFNLTGILYFPELSNSIELQKNKIQLYSNQVYVTDDVSQIVPEFLTLLHGVIDSPDIPLNVSRSYLQSDRNVKKITGYISRKVAEKLKGLFEKERATYESKWSEIGIFVKYGMISDEKFYEKTVDYALLKNTEGSYSTIEEYKTKVGENQKDKYDKQVFIYAQDEDTQHTFIDAVKAKGYDVLLMDKIIDNHFMQHIEMKLGDITFVRVDSDTPDNLVQKDEKSESVLSEKEQEKLKKLFVDKLKMQEYQLQLRPMSPEGHPVMITKPEFMRRMQEMQQMQGMDMAAMPGTFNVVVNSNHPLVAEKLMKMRSEEKKESFVQYLYDLARLNQGMLKGDEMSSFIKSSLELIG